MDNKVNMMVINSKKPPKCNYPNCIQNTRKDSINKENKICYFKSCHYCYTFYCSKNCRKLDWAEHKNIKCLYGCLSSYCKRILVIVGRHYNLRNELIKIAKFSYLKTRSRGFIWLDFSCADKAKEFINRSKSLLERSNFLNLFGEHIHPKYVCFLPTNNLIYQNDSIISQLFSNYLQNDDDNQHEFIPNMEYENFSEMCLTYNPEKEFILTVSIKTKINDEMLVFLQKKIRSKYIIKFLKIPFNLNKNLDSNLKKNYKKTNQEIIDLNIDNEPLPLILTSLKKSRTSNTNNNSSTEKGRQLFLANLLNEFEMRNINLRTTYPNIYKNLCLYVNENKPFTPISLFLRDSIKNNLFMCLIMPNSDPLNYSFVFEDQKQ